MYVLFSCDCLEEDHFDLGNSLVYKSIFEFKWTQHRINFTAIK